MRSQRRRKPMSDMNVVPYIDVMLVLLVIFMVTAPMMQAGVTVNLPNVDAKPLETNSQQEPLVLTVDVDGNYLLDDGSEIQLMAISQYVNSYLGEVPDKPIYVNADDKSTSGSVVRLMAAIQKAGATSIGMMADMAPANSESDR